MSRPDNKEVNIKEIALTHATLFRTVSSRHCRRISIFTYIYDRHGETNETKQPKDDTRIEIRKRVGGKKIIVK